MFKPGSVNVRSAALQIQTKEPIKSIRTASNSTERPLEMVKEDIVHIKHMERNKMNAFNIKPKFFTENS